jgi:hypothetical protein
VVDWACSNNAGKFGTNRISIGNMLTSKTREAAFGKAIAILTFEFMMYYFPRIPRHLKFHYDQKYCKWVYAYSIASNVTMELIWLGRFIHLIL